MQFCNPNVLGKALGSLNQIINGEKYVAAPNEKFKSLPDG